jgi:hypothetical protein
MIINLQQNISLKNQGSPVNISVANPDLVGSGPFWSDLALINDPISTFVVCAKDINTSSISLV